MAARRCWFAAVLVVALVAVAAAAPKVTFKTELKSDRNRYSLKLVYPVFSEDSPLYVAYNQTVSATMAELRKGFLELVAESRQYPGAPPLRLALDAEPLVSVYTDSLVSSYFSVYENAGGAHPNFYYLPLTYGLVHGRPAELRLQDLLDRAVTADDLIEWVLLPEINREKAKREIEPLEEIEPEVGDAFVVTPTAVQWVIGPYAVGPWAEGPYEIKVPFARLQGLLATDGPLAELLAKNAARANLVRVRGVAHLPVKPSPKARLEVLVTKEAYSPELVALAQFPATPATTSFELYLDPLYFAADQPCYLSARLREGSEIVAGGPTEPVLIPAGGAAAVRVDLQQDK